MASRQLKLDADIDALGLKIDQAFKNWDETAVEDPHFAGRKKRYEDLVRLQNALLAERGKLFEIGAGAGPSAVPDSPKARLWAWMKSNPLPSELNLGSLRQLLGIMPLPGLVRQVLQDCLFQAPADGLFACVSTANLLVACPRHDLVELLVKRACSLSPAAKVALVHGLRRTGKSFSMPWALLEAIRRLEQQAELKAPRRLFVVVVACHASEPLSLTDMPLLLAAAAFLKVPTIFDEFSKWPSLPGALEHFLAGLAQQPHITLLPLQFVLQDSMQSHVTQVAGPQGVLYSRANLGVLGATLMPQASVQLVAGMLQAYHQHLFPGGLLRVMATAGRMLDIIYAKPEVAPEALSMDCLRDSAILQADHLSALGSVMPHGSITLDLVLNSGNAAILQLREFGLLEPSPFDTKRLYLSDPRLITVNALQPAFASTPLDKAVYEELLMGAEGKVLEVLVRGELADSIIQHCNLAGLGQPSCQWGNIGKAEVDLLIRFEESLVWVSCKRSQAAQNASSFVQHIKAVAEHAASVHRGYEAKVNKSSADTTLPLHLEYARHPAVKIMRSMLGGGGLRLVGVSAISAAAGAADPFAGLGPMEITFEGQKHQVASTYQHVLLQDLVKPVPAEPVRIATCISV